MTIIDVGTEYDEDYDDDDDDGDVDGDDDNGDDDNDDDDDHYINQYNQRGSSDATKDQVFCTKEANEEGQLKNLTFLCLILILLNN